MSKITNKIIRQLNKSKAPAQSKAPDTDDAIEVPTRKGGKKKALIDTKSVEAALLANMGLTTEASKSLGISLEMLKKAIKDNPKLQKVVEATEEINLDFAESKLRNLIDKENVPAILFFLKCKGKARGYIEHADSNVVPTKPILFTYKPATREEIKEASKEVVTE